MMNADDHLQMIITKHLTNFLPQGHMCCLKQTKQVTTGNLLHKGVLIRHGI